MTESKLTEVMARISQVRVGMDDSGPCISFATDIKEGIGAHQFYFGKTMLEIIKINRGKDIQSLNGKNCWVVQDGNLIKLSRMWDSEKSFLSEEDVNRL